MARIGLVLSGGGARGAYQAGVLKGVSEIAAELGLGCPFEILTGVSAGAINAACLASWAGSDRCAARLSEFWSETTTRSVFRLDLYSIARIGASWAADLLLGGFHGTGRAHALLDTSPLRELLGQLIDFDAIATHLKSGKLQAVAVTATDYATSNSIAFVSSAASVPMWKRGRRHSEQAHLGLDHVMASCAIPLFFPSVSIGERCFGDGCLRNTAPLSPAVHLGAERLLVIGVRKQDSRPLNEEGFPIRPSVGQVLSVVLNAVLLDGTDIDVALLERTNELVQTLSAPGQESSPIRPIEHLTITPSEDIAQIALQEIAHAPKMLRYLLGGWGNQAETAELLSYLFFEPPFCRRLIDLGHKDAKACGPRIAALLQR